MLSSSAKRSQSRTLSSPFRGQIRSSDSRALKRLSWKRRELYRREACARPHTLCRLTARRGSCALHRLALPSNFFALSLRPHTQHRFAWEVNPTPIEGPSYSHVCARVPSTLPIASYCFVRAVPPVLARTLENQAVRKSTGRSGALEGEYIGFNCTKYHKMILCVSETEKAPSN
jgi:hypothetical protein